jgi:hypothetical protein
MSVNWPAWAVIGALAFLLAGLAVRAVLGTSGYLRYWSCHLKHHDAWPSPARQVYRFWCRTCQRGWGRVR